MNALRLPYAVEQALHDGGEDIVLFVSTAADTHLRAVDVGEDHV